MQELGAAHTLSNINDGQRGMFDVHSPEIDSTFDFSTFRDRLLSLHYVATRLISVADETHHGSVVHKLREEGVCVCVCSYGSVE